MMTTPTRPSEVAVHSIAYNPYQTKSELMRTFGRGERYIHKLIDDLEEYVAENPETYRDVSVFSSLSDSSRLYYNVFVVNHFIGYKSQLEAGMNIPFDYEQARREFHELVMLQADMMTNDQMKNKLEGAK